MQIKDQGLLKWPNKLPSIPKAKDRGKYYSFHNDHGHTSDRYFNLREEIENLIRRGYLCQFVSRNGKQNEKSGSHGVGDGQVNDSDQLHGDR